MSERKRTEQKAFDAMVEDIAKTPEETKAPKPSWYEKFLARRLLSSIRRHLIRKKELSSRPNAVKLVLALEELFDIPKLDNEEEVYTKEELVQLNSHELKRVLERATTDLEEML